MINKLTDTEIARVFAMYIGAPCALYDYAKEPSRWEPAYIDGVDMNSATPIIAERVGWPVAKVKLILIPIQLAINPGYSRAGYYLERRKYIKRITPIIPSQANYITQHMFMDYIANNLFFGVDHWVNSKDALDLGIAIPHRGYLFELAKQCYPNEDESQAYIDVLDYAREIGHNIDTKQGMLDMIKVLEDIKTLHKKTSK